MNLIKVNAIPSAFNRADNIIDSFEYYFMGSTTSVWECGGNHFEPQIWTEDAIDTNCLQNSIIHY